MEISDRPSPRLRFYRGMTIIPRHEPNDHSIKYIETLIFTIHGFSIKLWNDSLNLITIMMITNEVSNGKI